MFYQPLLLQGSPGARVASQSCAQQAVHPAGGLCISWEKHFKLKTGTVKLPDVQDAGESLEPLTISFLLSHFV